MRRTLHIIKRTALATLFTYGMKNGKCTYQTKRQDNTNIKLTNKNKHKEQKKKNLVENTSH